MKKLSLLLTLLFAFTSQAFAITATVNAVVVNTLTVSQTTALNFGSFSSSASSGTINQIGTTTGGVTAVSGGATRAAAVFSVSAGDSSSTPYIFTLPPTATIGIGGSAGTNQMTVTLAFASGSSSRTLSSGSDAVTVNGNLAVAANQASGTYTGTYLVTAAY